MADDNAKDPSTEKKPSPAEEFLRGIGKSIAENAAGSAKRNEEKMDAQAKTIADFVKNPARTVIDGVTGTVRDVRETIDDASTATNTVKRLQEAATEVGKLNKNKPAEKSTPDATADKPASDKVETKKDDVANKSAEATPKEEKKTGKEGENKGSQTTPPAAGQTSGDEEEGNFFTKNKFGLLAGFGSMLVMMMMGFDPLIAILGSLLLGGLGNMADTGGVMGQIFGGGQSQETDKSQGQSRAVNPNQQATQQDKKVDGAARQTADYKYLEDGKVTSEEFKKLLDGAKNNSKELREIQPFLQGGQLSDKRFVLLTPEAKDGNIGPVVFGKLNQYGRLTDIQVAREDGTIVSVPENNYDAQNKEHVKAILEASKNGEPISKGSATVDDIQNFLKTQFPSQQTPNKPDDKLAGRTRP